VSFPLLTAVFDVWASWGVRHGGPDAGVNAGIYRAAHGTSVVMKDVSGGFVKSVVFGLIVATICCYQGYTVHERAEGFGGARRGAVHHNGRRHVERADPGQRLRHDVVPHVSMWPAALGCESTCVAQPPSAVRAPVWHSRPSAVRAP